MKPSKNATGRTKNRIRDHSPLIVEQKAVGLHVFHGRDMLFVRSEDGWFGWLPEDEVDFESLD